MVCSAVQKSKHTVPYSRCIHALAWVYYCCHSPIRLWDINFFLIGSTFSWCTSSLLGVISYWRSTWRCSSLWRNVWYSSRWRRDRFIRKAGWSIKVSLQFKRWDPTEESTLSSLSDTGASLGEKLLSYFLFNGTIYDITTFLSWRQSSVHFHCFANSCFWSRRPCSSTVRMISTAPFSVHILLIHHYKRDLAHISDKYI